MTAEAASVKRRARRARAEPVEGGSKKTRNRAVIVDYLGCDFLGIVDKFANTPFFELLTVDQRECILSIFDRPMHGILEPCANANASFFEVVTIDPRANDLSLSSWA
jgi:hypothetical protein